MATREFPQLARLLDDWLLQRDGAPWRNRYTLVLPVRRMGHRYVLKVVPDESEFRRELEALLAFAGHGAVAVVEDDRHRQAMLLERIDGSNLASTWSVERDGVCTDRLVRAADRLAGAPLPASGSVPSLANHLRVLHRRDLPIPAEVERLRRSAAAVFEKLTASTESRTVLHADLHHQNLIEHGDADVVIDPLAAIGDRLYDTAPMLHNPVDQLAALTDQKLQALLTSRVGRIVARLSADPSRVLGWGLVRATASVLWCYEDCDFGLVHDVSQRCATVLEAQVVQYSPALGRRMLRDWGETS